MKFRAAVRDSTPLYTLCNVIKSFSRRALLRLHATTLRVIAIPSESSSSDGAQVWASMRSDAVFGDTRVESKHDNAVFCEIQDLPALCWVLKQCERQTGVVMKLAKVGARQMLSVSISGRIDAVHEVPIRVLADAEIQRIVAPPLADDVASVLLPPLQEIAGFVDGARAAGCSTCTVTVAPHGGGGGGADGGAAPPAHDDDLLADAPPPGGAETASLSLVADAPTMTFDAHYSSVHAAPGATLPSDGAVAVAVDVRRLSRFLAVRDLHPNQVIGHLDHRRALVISVFASAGSSLVFYLPAVVRV